MSPSRKDAVLPLPAQDAVKRTPVMADVARVAGVSAQTVSRVANGEQNVKEDTRRRVIRAMREVGYRPNGAARALKRGSYNSVGVITFTLESYGNIRTVDALAGSLAKRGYSVNLIVSSERTGQSVSGAYNRLADEAVDGVVLLFEAGLTDRAEADFPPGLPIVVVGSTRRGTTLPTVDVDQAQGARIATEHLVALGHTDIWHVSGPDSAFAANLREDTWRRVLEAHGLQTNRVFPGDWSAESGYVAGRALAERDDVSAVFAGNDSMAAGLIRALREAGRDVPGDVSVVGFDNAPDSAFLWPPLTTVDQDFTVVGELSARMLLDGVNSGAVAPVHSLVPTRLVVRQSTAAPRPR